MKKLSEIDFIASPEIQVSFASRYSGVDIDYNTATSTGKFFTEHLAIQLAGENYLFVSDICESWSYINEGEGVFHDLSSASDYELSCPQLNEHVKVVTERQPVYGDEQISTLGKHERFSWLRKKRLDSEWVYSISPSGEDTDTLKIFEMALATKVAAVSRKNYQANWKNADRWDFNPSDYIDPSLEGLLEVMPNASYAMTINVPFNEHNYNNFKHHIAATNPHFDMRIIDGFYKAKKGFMESYEPHEASEIADKLVAIMGKYDKQTQAQMVAYVDKVSAPIARNFIHDSYEKIFVTPNQKQKYSEPSL